MNQKGSVGRSQLYDPELPDACSVMASLLCVATVYAGKPSLELAKLAYSLAEKLTAPEYAESELICNVSRRLQIQWGFVVSEYHQVNHAVSSMKSMAH